MDKENVKSDLDQLCFLADQLEKDSSIPLEKRPFQFIIKTNQLNLSSVTKKFLIDLSNKDTISYEDFLVFAQRNEYKTFHCEALRRLIGQ